MRKCLEGKERRKVGWWRWVSEDKGWAGGGGLGRKKNGSMERKERGGREKCETTNTSGVACMNDEGGHGSKADFGLHQRYPFFHSRLGLGMNDESVFFRFTLWALSLSLSLFLCGCASPENDLKVNEICNPFYGSKGEFYGQSLIFSI